MLIKCPECGKDISDQAPACIHCGYPINKTNQVTECCGCYICQIDGQKYDLTIAIDYLQQGKMVECIKEIRLKTGLGLKETQAIVEKIQENNYQPIICASAQLIKESTPKCPKCGCTNIQVVRRNWSFFGGFATKATDRVCAKCNYKW